MVQGVFTYLLEGLGAEGVQFEELISLDAESLQALRYFHARQETASIN